MILTALCGYYQRAKNMPGADIIEPGYAMNGVSVEIVLSPEGKIIAVHSLEVLDAKGKKRVPRQMIVPLPPKRSGSRPEGAFLYETVAFLFGIFEKPEGAAHRFAESARVHREVLGGVEDEGAKALLKFFDGRTLGSVEVEGTNTELLSDPRAFAVFRLQGDGVFLHERPAVRAAWERHQAEKTGGAQIGQCLITGEMAPLARLHGNMAGFGADKPTLVGFNQPSFCSFGKEQGANAPVGERAAFEYVTALNTLAKDRRHCANLAGDKVLFWAERDAALEEGALQMMMEGADRGEAIPELDPTQRERILGILESVYKGKDPAACGLDPSIRFYLLGLSANKTRLVVRFFHQSTFGDLLTNLMRHYTDIAVDGARYKFPSPYYVLAEMALEHKRENVPKSVDAALMRSILDYAPYPWPLYQGVLRRIRAEGTVNALRAGILRGTVNRQEKREVLKMALDPNERDVPYVLGRLFALCEKAQRDALGDVNASIADKYLNAALASPRMVFPTLLALNQKHISKADNYYMRAKIIEAMGVLGLSQDGPAKSAFPESLDANGQGKFLVGYYHQIQALYTKKDKGTAEAADETGGADSTEA